MLRMGIDVGGTFTDLLLHDTESEEVWLAKTPSTPQNQSVGVLEGIAVIGRLADVGPERLDAILHGTTVATNAVLEKRGARVGLIVSEGWRSMLHLAEAWTPGPLFGWMIYEKPEPIADYEDTREVPGRMAADGTVVRALDRDAARAAVADLRDRGVEALTVSLMNAFASPEHEREVAEIARAEAPGLSVSISCDVMPEFREYERTVTTVMNAYVSPVLDRYLSSLRTGLDEVRAGADLQVVRSDGGLMSLESARSIPVHTMLSGPAGGVKGASFVAAAAGFDRILTFDMGGTSTDVATCSGGQPIITRETTVGEFPVRAPSVEVESIGAGGGSIAYIADMTGALRVGPQSAGADPGPACYGRGGTQATVTDANVVLGHLPPRLLGGEIGLDVDAAHASVDAIASRLGLDVHAAAAGIVDIVNENMLGALRVVTVQKGLPPSEFALVSFGGAGGLHANALAALLGCFPVLVPPESGVLSALGFVAAEIKNEFSETFIRDAEDTDADELRARLGALAGLADEWLAGERVADADRRVDYVVDTRYQRQGFEIPIDVGAGELPDLTLEALTERFNVVHERLYGFRLPSGAEIVSLRAVAQGGTRSPQIPRHDPGPADPSAAQSGTHTVWAGGVAQEVPTYSRAQLHAGARIEGYAIVEQYDATTIVLPGHVATVDPYLNLLIAPEAT
ncbi:MAG TPA: hydantoinase/oxoprolinase family protein [Solirubrobacteraceae bacterium]|nr:hydantoinase/oxoprolinase family protein [Solirubrobacteraceae bacterium]